MITQVTYFTKRSQINSQTMLNCNQPLILRLPLNLSTPTNLIGLVNRVFVHRHPHTWQKLYKLEFKQWEILSRNGFLTMNKSLVAAAIIEYN